MIKISHRRNMRFLIYLFIYHYTRKIEGIIMSKVCNFNDSLLLTFLMFFGELFGGLAIFIYQKYFFAKKVEDNPRYTWKLIHTNIEVTEFKTKDSAFTIVILIFFASFFDFAQFLLLCLIPELAILSPTSDQRLCVIITITSSLLCTYGLRIKTGKHHFFSLVGMSLCSFIIFIIELIYKLRGTNFENFILAYALAICRLIFISFIDVIERYLLEFNFLNKYKLLSLEGFFGIILCSIYCLVIHKSPFEKIQKVYNELNIWKDILLIFFVILFFALSAGINIYKIICNYIYSPMAKSLPAYLLNPIFIIYYFFYENDFKVEGNNNYIYLISNIILSIIIDFFACVYNEFLIIFYCDLEKETHYGISLRAEVPSLSELKDLESLFND